MYIDVENVVLLLKYDNIYSYEIRGFVKARTNKQTSIVATSADNDFNK